MITPSDVGQRLQAVRLQAADGIELHGGEPAVDVAQDIVGRLLGRIAHLPAVQVGVGAQLVVEQAAEQVVHRFPERLADDVPARHVDGAQQRGGDGAGMEHGVAPEHVPPDALPAHRIGALQNLLEDLLRHLQRRLPVGAVPGALAGALDAVIGDQLDEQPVLAALARRRHRHEIPLEPLDLHGPTVTGMIRRRKSLRWRAQAADREQSPPCLFRRGDTATRATLAAGDVLRLYFHV